MKVLITGANGQLGRDCAVAFSGCEIVLAGRQIIDLTKLSSVRQTVAEIGPHVVVNCAAYTAVDRAESEPELAHTVNALGAQAVAQGCADIGARLIHVSTDYVYDGTKPSPYVEGDATNPLSVYGRSKLEGEFLVTSAMGHERATIVRTSWVCGEHGSNIIRTVLSLMAADPNRTLKFVDDQFGHPTITNGLAAKIRELVGAELGGLFHVTHQGATSWHGFVAEILAAAGYSRDQVQPIGTSELTPPRPAPRPMNSVLANTGLADRGLALLPDFRDVLPEVVAKIRA